MLDVPQVQTRTAFCFLSSTSGLPFHTTNNQAFTSSFIMQPLGKHLTVISVGSCSLCILLWYGIMYGGNLLPFTTADSYMRNPMFESPHFLPQCQ